MFTAIDGKLLEKEILSQLPSLQSLELFIHSTSTDSENRNMATFRTAPWQRLAPVVYYQIPENDEHWIFTVPHSNKVRDNKADSSLSSHHVDNHL